MQRRGVIAALGLGGAWAGHALANGPARLRVAWDDYPPFQMAGKPGHKAVTGPQGLDIDLCSAVLQAAGMQPDWQHMPWARQLLALQDGSLELMLNASISEERKAFALWTLPYRSEEAALVALRPPDPQVKGLRDLLGTRARIGVIRGATYPGEMDMLLREPAFQRLLTPVRHMAQGMQMLRQGRLDYLIDEPPVLNHLAQQTGTPALHHVHWVYRGASRLMLAKRSEAAYPGLLAALDQAILHLRSLGRLSVPERDD